MRPRRNSINLGQSGPSQIYQKLSSIPVATSKNQDQKRSSRINHVRMVNEENMFFKNLSRALNKCFQLFDKNQSRDLPKDLLKQISKEGQVKSQQISKIQQTKKGDCILIFFIVTIIICLFVEIVSRIIK